MTKTRRRKPPVDIFDITKTNLEKFLKEIDEGEMQLPNFQRNWRWTNNRIMSLVESIAEGHPIGAPMFLETGGKHVFEHRPFEAAPPRAVEHTPKTLVLDGQQRMTSIYQACYKKEPVVIQSDKKNHQYRLYYFDISKAIDADEKLGNSIISVSVDENGRPNRKGVDVIDYTDPDIQYARGCFPLNMMFDSAWTRGFEDYWDQFPSSPERKEARSNLQDFKEIIIDPFHRFMIPVIVLKGLLDPGDICQVYEKLNSSGMSLDAFDLLIANYAAQGHNLRADWFGDKASEGYKRLLSNRSKDILKALTPKLFMQAVSMAVDLRKGSNVLGTSKLDVLGLPLADYQLTKADVVDGYVKAAKFLQHEGIYNRAMAPPVGIITALAVVLTYIGNMYDNHIVQKRLRRWFKCIVYTGAYAQGTNMALSFDVPAVVRWLMDGADDAKEPRTVSGADIMQKKIRFATRKASPSFHNAIGTSIIRSSPLDFATGRPLTAHDYADGGHDLHHVFSVKWCRANNIPDELMDSIVNKTPISIRTNRQIGGKSPSEYIADLEASGLSPDEVDAILKSHGIDAAFLRADDFYGFFEQRLSSLTEMVSRDLGRAVILDADGADEDSSSFLDEGEVLPDDAMWRLASRGAVIYLKKEDDQYLVAAGSTMTPDANKSLNQTYILLREALIEDQDGDVPMSQLDDDRWLLLKDYEVNSPSAAVCIFSGRMAGSSSIWRDRDGNPARP